MTLEEYNEDIKATREGAEKRVERKFKDFIDPNSDDYQDVLKQVNEFKEKTFTEKLSNEFKNLNGNEARLDDFRKIAGLTQDASDKDIKKAVETFRENENYKFLFKEGVPGVNTPEENQQPVEAKPATSFHRNFNTTTEE